MEKYIFSGNMQPKVFDVIRANPDIPSISLLCTQLERGAFKKYSEFREEGFCDFLMVDSGAYSVFTGRANTTIDQYIDWINENADGADSFVELDTIPGEWRKSKRPEHYIMSAEKSWKDFLYMRERVSCPQKIVPVFHSGESFDALRRMLEYRDSEGNPLEYVGISAAKDASNQNRDIYLQDVIQTIEGSSNPHVKTHLFGTTALGVLREVPCFSCDSTTHVRLAGFGIAISKHFGQINVSTRGRKSGADQHFIRTADENNLRILEDECKEVGITLEQLQTEVYARCAFNMYNILDLVNTKYSYHPKNALKRKRLI